MPTCLEGPLLQSFLLACIKQYFVIVSALLYIRANPPPAPGDVPTDVEAQTAQPDPAPSVTYKDLFLRFVWLGWVAFGGPTAHIALFQKVCV